MEDAKRRATIRNQAVKRKETDEGAMGTDSSKPSAKKRPCSQEVEGFDGACYWSNGGGQQDGDPG